jgi:hypothetical protein
MMMRRAASILIVNRDGIVHHHIAFPPACGHHSNPRHKQQHRSTVPAALTLHRTSDIIQPVIVSFL